MAIKDKLMAIEAQNQLAFEQQQEKERLAHIAATEKQTELEAVLPVIFQKLKPALEEFVEILGDKPHFFTITDNGDAITQLNWNIEHHQKWMSEHEHLAPRNLDDQDGYELGRLLGHHTWTSTSFYAISVMAEANGPVFLINQAATRSVHQGGRSVKYEKGNVAIHLATSFSDPLLISNLEAALASIVVKEMERRQNKSNFEYFTQRQTLHLGEVLPLSQYPNEASLPRLPNPVDVFEMELQENHLKKPSYSEFIDGIR